MMAHVPNLLTLLRIAAAPVLILLLNDDRYGLALLVFALAGISDGLDGYIAKRFGYESRLGGLLDPLADKVLIVSTCVMLMIKGVIPLWLLVTIGFRDFMIIGGFLLLTVLYGQLQLKPSVISKVNTVMQISLVVGALLARAAGVEMQLLIDFLVAAVLFTTLASLVHYTWLCVVSDTTELAESRTETYGDTLGSPTKEVIITDHRPD